MLHVLVQPLACLVDQHQDSRRPDLLYPQNLVSCLNPQRSAQLAVLSEDKDKVTRLKVMQAWDIQPRTHCLEAATVSLVCSAQVVHHINPQL